jgi:hypothetical protein
VEGIRHPRKDRVCSTVGILQHSLRSDFEHFVSVLLQKARPCQGALGAITGVVSKTIRLDDPSCRNAA